MQRTNATLFCIKKRNSGLFIASLSIPIVSNIRTIKTPYAVKHRIKNADRKTERCHRCFNSKSRHLHRVSFICSTPTLSFLLMLILLFHDYSILFDIDLPTHGSHGKIILNNNPLLGPGNSPNWSWFWQYLPAFHIYIVQFQLHTA